MHSLLKWLLSSFHAHWFELHHSDENFYYYECRCGHRSFAYLAGSKGEPDFAWVQGLKRAEYSQLSPNARKSRARREILTEVQPHIARGNALHRRAQRAESQLQRMLRKLMELPQPTDRVWLVWDKGAERKGICGPSTRRVFHKAADAESFARSLGWEGQMPDHILTEAGYFRVVSTSVEVLVSCLPVQ